MISENGRPAEVNYNNLELEQSDVNETVGPEEVIQSAKAAEDFEKKKAPPLKSRKPPPAQDKLITKFQNELNK